MRTRRRLLFASLVTVVAACGSRTGLLVPDDFDVPADAKGDGGIIHRIDAGEEDALDEAEALPPLDVRPPPPDVAIPSDCGVDAHLPHQRVQQPLQLLSPDGGVHAHRRHRLP